MRARDAGLSDEAWRYIAECKARVAEMYKATPMILVPAATGPAPLGLASTGDASERTVDRLGSTRRLHSHAASQRVAAWASTHGRPRPRCKTASHCGAASKNARQWYVLNHLPRDKYWAILPSLNESQQFSSTRTLWDGALPTIFTS